MFRLSLLVLAVAISGCGGSDPAAPSNDAGPNDNAPAARAGDPASAEVSLQVKSWDETLALIKASSGKPVVLDLWSTSCAPCMREFPNLVKLHGRLGDRVTCMSINLDYAGIKKKPVEKYRDEVLEFLTSNRAEFTNVLCSDPDDEVFAKLDLASIPAVMVFDAEGKLLKRFDNDEDEYGDDGFSYEKHIVPLIEEQLAKAAATSDKGKAANPPNPTPPEKRKTP